MNQNQPQQIQLRAREEDIKGSYSNFMEVKHTKEEFCMDFFNFIQPFATLSARIVTSPGHMKRITQALQQNLDNYEKQFGAIETAEGPGPSEIGFAVK